MCWFGFGRIPWSHDQDPVFQRVDLRGDRRRILAHGYHHTVPFGRLVLHLHVRLYHHVLAALELLAVLRDDTHVQPKSAQRLVHVLHQVYDARSLFLTRWP